MLTKNLLEKINQKINQINKEEENNKEEKIEIKKLDLNNVEIKEKKKYGFIDSSLVNGIVGPYSYIYSRAVIVSDDIYESIEDIEFFETSFIRSMNNENFDIQDISELLSKNLEYKLARKYSDRYIFIDGSIISDSILYSKFLYNFYDENVENRRKEFLENFEYLINNGNLLAVAKRILNLDIIREGRSDLLTLMKVFPSEIFYTDIKEKQLKEFLSSKIPNCPFCNKKIYITYFRARYNDHIYRLEGMEKVGKEKFKEIIKEVIYDQKSYPRGLKMAHNLCKITNKEKTLLESYIKKILGFEKTVGWETH
jgi:hypothetical protein